MALELICNAEMLCAVPPTAMKEKMIEELKKHWSTLMQRVSLMMFPTTYKLSVAYSALRYGQNLPVHWSLAQAR